MSIDMSEVKSWGLIGPGGIGGELSRQLREKETVANRLGLARLPAFTLRSSGIYIPSPGDGGTVSEEQVGGLPSNLEDLSEEEKNQEYLKLLSEFDSAEFPDVVFVATPTYDEGEPAYSYIKYSLDMRSLVVTAEKGAMANNFLALKEQSDDFRRLGINATVGGGTRLMQQAKEYCTDKGNVTQIHLVLNGTIANILASIAPPGGSGMSLGQAVEQAVQLRYAEPGMESPFNVIRGEAEGDIPKKTAIFFNTLGLGEILDWRKLKFDLTDEEIARVVEESNERRFIVSMYPDEAHRQSVARPENDIIGGFNVEVGGGEEVHSWQIIGGFRHVGRNPLFSDLARLTGPGNGMIIGLGPNESDGVYKVTGPGAGVGPTVNTMLDDYINKSERL